MSYEDAARADLVKTHAEHRAVAEARAQEYQSRFEHWEDRASVRRKPLRRMRPDASPYLYFPPELMPVADHPLVLSVGPQAREQLLLQRLYDYLDFTTELESLAVIPIGQKLSRGRAGFSLPPAMRADAFAIVTDEAWHAQFSYDFVQHLEAETGVQRAHTTPAPTFALQLDRVRDRLPDRVQGVEGVLFAIVSETLISGILAGLPNDRRLPPAVRELVRDHAEDEGRHHAYFRQLLRYLWPALSIEDRAAVGPWLPEIIRIFLSPDFDQITHHVASLGLMPDAVAQVMAESLPADKVRTDIRTGSRSTVRYFAEAGVLDDPATHAAFEDAGLLPD
ncbi:hypothetical protein ASD11_17540 [Aeromicrobium sp. Root495]|uniref:diiron oxygenase n=1 Tax=Aeromicrobium sp. Root495 TaxID=1736550 RepID=UPI0007012859|nr:diiron oxygenase [Aeromicrobium sp. Root495]KQY55346.1 hypothetical protein ASD11_17540 [Aeromicrobium sp. Root495]